METISLLSNPVLFIETQPFLFLILIVMIISWWRVFKKIGYPGWLSISFLIPVLIPIVMIWMGFHKWPIEKNFH